jgi:hypothetical protein
MSESKEVENESTVLASNRERTHSLTLQKLIVRWFEVITAIMLGVVAIATAWSGFQAARWDGEQAAKYVQASDLRVESARYSTQAGQVALYDTGVFNQWLFPRRNKTDKLIREALPARVQAGIPGLVGNRSVQQPECTTRAPLDASIQAQPGGESNSA